MVDECDMRQFDNSSACLSLEFGGSPVALNESGCMSYDEKVKLAQKN